MSLKLPPRGERYHEINGADLTINNILNTQVLREVVEDLL